MNYDKPIRRVAIVGTGVIGASWAAQYLACGLDVIATDPAPDAEAGLRKYIDDAWDALTTLGLAPGASRERLTVTTDMAQAVSQADLVQENGPERPEFKKRLFADIDAATPVDSIIASSSSGITPSVMQSECKHPERILVGHPFNPPHLIPLVEVVGGAKTSPEALGRAMKFYADIGKKPILLHKEMPGHVANRLQIALFREVLYLIEQGVLSVGDADAAVSWGPGLRWALMGPGLQYHVSGGAGGIHHFLQGVFEGLLPVLKTLGDPVITLELKTRLAEGVLQEAGARSIEQLTSWENEQLVALLKLRADPNDVRLQDAESLTHQRNGHANE
ncbi:3-hydroxyacyl-CoA dehydrogenase NAD-binding domain-containing protein [Variovorax sp. J22P240]|uniref:3-hydroxyacyl-CoA dehydrogenase NAD-binding domain-containing protein n=1 Tax=Variovorax sp. J22P240 TaxID=3053514 RepID=UPI002574D5E9|nr:3-hydroxyacyl-CoA dehydrogenase NAD-binding domain-containing protein [Variovorax sp. J22P240]MDM0001221.1 3-hydroxyacyl-CoA dehydrogenase NAD-binding domain-containing protein [Variovorax sp. J22P240]